MFEKLIKQQKQLQKVQNLLLLLHYYYYYYHYYYYYYYYYYCDPSIDPKQRVSLFQTVES